jgi:anti-sigma factor RsiW
MTGRILHLQGSEHAVADALLPWYVNGTLRGDELARLERHLGECPQCRSEVEWLRKVFAGCAAMAPLPDAAESAEAVAIPASARSAPHPWPARAAAGWRASQPWMRALVAAQFAALAVLGALLAVDAGTAPAYRTLGADTRAAPAGDTIAVMFDPAITEAELRRVVIGAGARIVDGPTSTHAFIVEVPPAGAPDALRRLRAEPAVRFAESLGKPER